MKSMFYWLGLIVSITVLISSCAKSDDGSTSSTDNSSSSSTTELEGTWVSSCYQTSYSSELYDIQSITFTGSAFIFK